MLRINTSPHRREQGITIIEFLMSIGLVLSMLAAVTSSFFHVTRRSYDNETINRAEEQARTVLDMLAYDIRMTGSGMPLGQPGFAIGGLGLGTAPLPLFTDSTATLVHFRLNEQGRDSVLSAAWTPSAAARTFTVLSAADLHIGNTIYVNSMPLGGTSALQGTITALAGTSVTIANGYVATVGAVFNAGSLVSHVTTATYDSPNDWSGILRDDGTGDVLIAADSTFSIQYLDGTGTALALPLTEAQVANNLTSAQLTVSVRGAKPLADGSTYTATAQQVVTFRNLLLIR